VKNAILATTLILSVVLLGSHRKMPAQVTQASASTTTPSASWLIDYKKAQEEAKSNSKFMLLNFTGSDWCPGCIMLRRDVFDSDQFRDYASKNFVLVEVDFPRGKLQRPEVAEQNQTLAERFGIQVFPTVVILNSEGKKVGVLLGYDPSEGAKGYIAELEKFRKG
jgi:thioredoxin-related protein